MEVLYEDNHIIIVNKSSGEIVQGDKTGDRPLVEILKDWIKEKYNKPGNVFCGLVHRLDRPVSGVVVFAKTSKAASRLSEEVRVKQFEKKYLVIANGKFESDRGTWEDYLLKNEAKNMSKVVKEGTKNSKLAVLDYEVIKYDPDLDLTVAKINLHTGRHHQIRVQFSSRMHALYGDNKYHGRGAGTGICLWAYELSFKHPVSKEEMNFEKYPEKSGMWSKMI